LKSRWAEAESDGVPQLGFTAQAAAALAIEAGFAGLHDGDVAGGELVGERVGVEVGAGVDLRTAFEHQDVGAEVGQTV